MLTMVMQIVESETKKEMKSDNIKAENLFWYEEFWNDEDLEIALENAEIEVTVENVARQKQACLHIFDDKSDRNAMLTDMVRDIFGRS
ncbi:MAG: hypothetical protein LUH07_13040 [Lachnospiraceae bacterium]|nr:hypothetical protein [Lachnospiraceae bacterium]